MIPDKIYTDNRGVYAELPIFSQADANIEYLRKDALLEWLEKKVGISYGVATEAFVEVIDKLNSL